jgi:DNA polymerase III alpha subunit (gram-positive type)
MSEDYVRRYIAIDNETGGLDPETSLLTSYMAALDENLNVLDDLDLTLKPNNEIYCVEAGGLAINKIDLVEHQKDAITYSAAGQLLRNWLIKHSEDKAVKLIPFGHNVTFDVLSIHKYLLNRATFEQYTSYRKFDTAVIAQFLKYASKLPEDLSGSLESLAKYFGVLALENHTARGDVLTTISVAKAMKGLL